MYSDNAISLMIPDTIPSGAELEKKYPPRELPAGALVTRFGPSPTGFLHIGGVYTAMISKNIALQSDGAYFVRIEDTDKKREVAGVQEHFDEAFAYFDIAPTEDDSNGHYGPYKQSSRQDLYLSFVKQLLQKERAYPCFCSEHDLQEKSDEQRREKVDTGYYGRWATCRSLDPAEAERRIANGEEYVIRFRCEGEPGPFVFEDKIRGKTKVKNNINDVVILKSSANAERLPTYHLAHAVDDHLMRVNLVIRGEEWLASVPLHLQLFDALGFEPIPYAHIAPLMKMDGKSRRKLSKRKDPEASVEFYMQQGYPTTAVLSYLRGLANSKLANTTVEESLSLPILLEDCQVSGALVDLVKLNDVSANIVATMSAVDIREQVYAWAKQFDSELESLMSKHWDAIPSFIDADRFNNGRTRKDLTKWSDFTALYGFFFNEVFAYCESAEDARFDGVPAEVVSNFLSLYKEGYTHAELNEDWFENLKAIAKEAGFAMNNKEYKQAPERFHGTMKEASLILRIVITGRNNSPSLHEVCQLIGKDEVLKRIAKVL
ncbi:glutamate--tRNA ligase [Alteromonas gilva]|uniref:Glutamate--tRNA ligase family protein n=1 Tax=Alteromonas gilva TaxID=2987522 RepID=A0ABT5L1I7_9ALTE|nr:glutamate--tRNA ligase family protein [Alteromonas gilva]MDC8829732.1 glutamate--tRNA ligase family protein [Alteromonas gilva]